MINGIKPEISKQPKPKVVKPSTNGLSFDEAMTNLLSEIQVSYNNWGARSGIDKKLDLKLKPGRKFIKVKYFETKINTNYETGDKTIVKDENGSIHCFVDKNTGDIYKPASWKAPYTKGNNAVRGNIYDESCYEKTDLYGGWLYAK